MQLQGYSCTNHQLAAQPHCHCQLCHHCKIGGQGGGTICSLCKDGRELDPAASINFQGQKTMCGDLNAMLGADGILDGSAMCTSVRGAYCNDCCLGECRTCKTSGGYLMDLRREHLVRQGG